MDILNRLKKEKKPESVFDSVIKKKEKETKVEPGTVPADIVVTHISQDKTPPPEKPLPVVKEPPVKREFRTEGMHEFELDSLGIPDKKASIKAEYRAKVIALIDKEQYGEAIETLMELQMKLDEKTP